MLLPLPPVLQPSRVHRVFHLRSLCNPDKQAGHARVSNLLLLLLLFFPFQAIHSLHLSCSRLVIGHGKLKHLSTFFHKLHRLLIERERERERLVLSLRLLKYPQVVSAPRCFITHVHMFPSDNDEATPHKAAGRQCKFENFVIHKSIKTGRDRKMTING